MKVKGGEEIRARYNHSKQDKYTENWGGGGCKDCAIVQEGSMEEG